MTVILQEGDRELAELIIKDMQLYHEIVDSYSFKTEQLHINLVAAVNNFHKVQDDMTKEECLGNSKMHRAVPAKVDYDRLAPYFLYCPKQVIQKTLENTTQLAKAVVNTLLRQHLKSCFLMLRHLRLNEVVATDNYFSNTRSIEGYWCAQVFVGLTSRRITVIGMKTDLNLQKHIKIL